MNLSIWYAGVPCGDRTGCESGQRANSFCRYRRPPAQDADAARYSVGRSRLQEVICLDCRALRNLTTLAAVHAGPASSDLRHIGSEAGNQGNTLDTVCCSLSVYLPAINVVRCTWNPC